MSGDVVFDFRGSEEIAISFHSRTYDSDRLVSGSFANRLQHVRRLRQDRFFEVRVVRHRAVQRADALHRRVEVLEQLAADAGRQLGAEAARHLVFVRDDDAVRALDEAAIASQSYGMIVRRSSTATLMSSFSACCAASSDRCTSAPQVTTST